jgi:hypothetical protein
MDSIIGSHLGYGNIINKYVVFRESDYSGNRTCKITRKTVRNSSMNGFKSYTVIENTDVQSTAYVLGDESEVTGRLTYHEREHLLEGFNVGKAKIKRVIRQSDFRNVKKGGEGRHELEDLITRIEHLINSLYTIGSIDGTGSKALVLNTDGK